MPAPPVGVHEQTLGEGVLRWTFDNAERKNAISPAVFVWIAARSAELAGEVVIVRGAGDEGFTAGFDLTALAENNLLRETGAPDRSLIAATEAMQESEATFIAAINGYVIGAGVEMISACDFRLARFGASLRLPAGRLGVVYHAAGLTRIHAALGATVTRRLILAGEKVPIEDVRASLCAIVSAEQLDRESLALARRIREQSPASVAGNRRLLRALDRHTALPDDLLAAHEQARREAYEELAKQN